MAVLHSTTGTTLSLNSPTLQQHSRICPLFSILHCTTPLIYHITSYYIQSPTIQQDVKTLSVMLSELGSCEKFSDLGPYAKQGVNKDLYNLGMYMRM